MDASTEILIQAGLSEKEAALYLNLLASGSLSVLALSKGSGLKRTNLYNVLEALEEKGLVKKVDDTKSTRYFPNSPAEIQKLLDIKESQLSIARGSYDLLRDKLQSQYNLVCHKPTVIYLEGIAGLKKLYLDILATGKDIMLLRSTFDDKRSDVDKVVQKQIAEQVKKGIRTKAIGPFENSTVDTYKNLDAKRLVERKILKKTPFNLPAQIIIYGDKTAISTIREEIIITIIDNPDVTKTFVVLFEALWKLADNEHKEFIQQL